MYPPQTSLIPVQIALARFLESFDGLRINALFGNYPFWYLGTTSYRYLTGPILPLVLSSLHRILPFLSLFEIMLGLVGVMWVVGGVGVHLLVKEMRVNNGLGGIKKGDRIATLAAFFYVFGPIMPFLFRFSDGIYLIAFSFLPYILLKYLGWLKSPKLTKREAVFLVILISFLILIDSLILPSLILGIATVLLATTSWKKIEKLLKKTFLIFIFSLLICTLWYTPGYWLTLLGAPSLGGMGVLRVVAWLGKILPTALALVMAVFSVKFFKKRNLLRDFCFYWLFTFGFLSVLRFLSDPDFWLDWSAYGVELQLGIAMLGGLWLGSRSLFRREMMSDVAQKRNLLPNFGHLAIFTLMAFCLLLFAFIFNKYVLGTLQPDIEQTVEYRIGKQLSEIAKPGERVFLSGTTAFWLNSFFDIPQVRGGRDQAAVDTNWRKAVWEIREGATAEGTKKWLKGLNISYLVVHTYASKEFYHDFAHPEKFEGVEGLEKVYNEAGDAIYRFSE